MHTLKLPQAGQTMEEGTIVRWLKSEGEPVRKGDVLLEVETDKAVVEVESDSDGVLKKILCEEGSTQPVQTPLALIGAEDEEIEGAGEATEPSQSPASEGKTIVSEESVDVKPVLLPQSGQTMEEGTIVKWRVKPGDRIEQGQIICDVETDKAVVEVEATDSGRLARIAVPEGEFAKVLTPVAYLAESDEAVDEYLKARNEFESSVAQAAPVADKPKETEAPKEEAGATEEGRIKASPAAKKLAKDKGVDLASIDAGSGPEGRIVRRDVEQAESVSAEPIRQKMSRMRQVIAKNLTASKQNIPHFYMRVTIDAAPVFSLYRQKKNDIGCSLNDFIVLACAKAIREFPAFRTRLEGEELVEYPTANIGIAVGLENGLVVPVIVGVDRMNLKDLAAESRRLIEAAKGGKVENMGKGVFTISNLGMFGVEEFSAIINPPEAAILAVSAIREEAIVSGGAMRPGRVMTMTLSCDHRVIDGLLAAKFCARLKEILEAPEGLVGE